MGSANFHDAIAKGWPLYPPIVNAPFQQFDRQINDMDTGAHAFQNISVAGGTADATTIGANAPAPGTFTTVAVSGDLNYGSCFKANINLLQSVQAAATDRVAFDEIFLDNDDDFDVTTHQFTPSVAGWYFLSARLLASLSAGAKQIKTLIYKNGAVAHTTSVASVGTLINAFQAITVQQANGSTDYFDVYFYNGDSGTVTLATQSTFLGFRIR